MSIVQTDTKITYAIMRSNLHELNNLYPFMQIQNAGYSVLGKQLPVVRLGRGKKKVFYTGSFHANEWITSIVLMKFIEEYCEAYVKNSTLYGYNIRTLFKNSSIYIMPMVNPDGVDIVNRSISKKFTNL